MKLVLISGKKLCKILEKLGFEKNTSSWKPRKIHSS